MEKSGTISLVGYTESYKHDLRNFYLPQSQARFTTLPSEYEDSSEGKHRIIILNEDRPVGFFLLDSSDAVESYTFNQDAMLLASFSINHEEQGKGYAKQALNRLKTFVQSEYPGCSEILLSVNHKNTAAKRLYEKDWFSRHRQNHHGACRCAEHHGV